MLAEAASRVFAVYRSDVIEAGIIVLTLTAVGALVGRPRLALIAWVTISFGVMVAAIEWIALRQTGMPLTYDNLLISVNWAREHPQVIPTVMPWAGIGLMVIFIAVVGAVPWLRAAAYRAGGTSRKFASSTSAALALVASVLFASALFTADSLRPSWSHTLSPTEGFWSSNAAALANLDSDNPQHLPVLSRAALLASYHSLEYPRGTFPSGMAYASLPKRIPRHVVLIVLETAPRKYYPIDTDTAFHTFHSMLASSIAASNHFTPRPSTLFAIYSMITGTYPRPGTPIGEYGHFHNDGLASVLGSRGYETTYIDSYRVDWAYHNRSELQQQGFSSILDTAGFRPPDSGDPFQTAVARERWSMLQGLRSVAHAQRAGRKAFVVVATTLGHFPWRSPRGHEGDPAPVKLKRIGMSLDSAVGELLLGLDSLRLRDSTIVIVTGDHGLRYAAEFRSFGFPDRPKDVDFNVPFILSAPGLINAPIRITQVTSHVDIAPTVCALLGIPADTLVLQGVDMLSDSTANRVVFLMNSGIYPDNAFVYRGIRYDWNSITNAVTTSIVVKGQARASPPMAAADVREELASADHVFSLTAAYFLSRGDHSAVQR